MNNSDRASILIRRAESNDLDEVAPLFDAYRGFYAQEPGLAKAREFLRERMAASESVIFIAYARVAQQCSPAVGFTQLYPLFSSVRLCRKWLLNDLFVAAEFRRMGVGRSLMSHAITFARQTHARALELSTAFDNLQAQRLYESMGFAREQQFFHYELVVDATE